LPAGGSHISVRIVFYPKYIISGGFTMDPVIAIIVAVAALLLIFIVFGYTDFRK
jgi:hypothetical protein